MWKLFADCRAGVLSGITVTPKRPAQAPKEIEKNGLSETYANFFKVLIAVFCCEICRVRILESLLLSGTLSRGPVRRRGNSGDGE
tara:strand:- start:89 stop:343 length:255 start_codon:yes stop_codon:yes gene_type:complete